MESRPRALFVTSHPPDANRYGGTQRALNWVRALSTRYRVTLLELRVWDLEPEVMALLETRCSLGPSAWWDLPAVAWWLFRTLAPETYVRRSGWRRFWRPVTAVPLARARRDLAGGDFDLVVAYTLEGAVWVEALGELPGGAERVLDLPDVESVNLERTGADGALSAEAEACRRIEGTLASTFSRVHVCSPEDRDLLLGHHPELEVRVVPNVPETRTALAAPSAIGGPTTFLYVGDMGYAPNREGLDFFLEEVAPLLDLEWRLEIAGRRSETLGRGDSRVRGHGWVDDLADLYAEADVVLAPILSGTGTRTKILEAFGYGRPVVSTPRGVEGLGAEAGTHHLEGATSEEFAAACRRLAGDVDLRRDLAARARALVDERFSPEVFTRAALGGEGGHA